MTRGVARDAALAAVPARKGRRAGQPVRPREISTPAPAAPSAPRSAPARPATKLCGVQQRSPARNSLVDHFRGKASADGQDMRLGALTAMALATAARIRFAAGWFRADVIRYVAQALTRYGLDDFAPSLAEDLRIVALGNQPLPPGADPASTVYARSDRELGDPPRPPASATAPA
jgi:hypothetical protein